MFKRISRKQALAYTWWRLKKFADTRIMILNGAIRTGKTDFGSKGWLDWAIDITTNTIEKMKGWNTFALIAATKQTAYENVILEWITYLEGKGYIQATIRYKLQKYKRSYHINEQMGILTIKTEGVFLRIRYIGANNKKATERIQGMTLRGLFIDEAGLIGLNIIENAIGRCATWRDHRIVMTTNPEGNESHPFYMQYIKGAWHRGILVLSFWLLDNPIFTMEDVEYYRRIFTPSMFMRKIKGLWVRATGAIYKSFSRKKHVVDGLYKQAQGKDYAKLYVGIDYGETAATVFTLEGQRNRNIGLDILTGYYHKNNPYDEKDINDYADDFFKWIVPIYEKFGKIINVKVESATHGKSFYKIIKARAKKLGYNWLRIEMVNKYKKDPQSAGAILERIDTLNMMLGAEFIRIDSEMKHLIAAIQNAVWKKDKEERLDNETSDIDSLDSLEYGFLDLILAIRRRIEYMR